MKRRKDKRKDHSESSPDQSSSPTLGSLFSDVFAKAKSLPEGDTSTKEESSPVEASSSGKSAHNPSKPQTSKNQTPQKKVSSRPKNSKSFSKNKWRVELSTKGRRGKTVTLVSGIKDLEHHRKILQSRLGTGAHIEGDTLVIRGDQRKAIESYLNSLQ